MKKVQHTSLLYRVSVRPADLLADQSSGVHLKVRAIALLQPQIVPVRALLCKRVQDFSVGHGTYSYRQLKGRRRIIIPSLFAFLSTVRPLSGSRIVGAGNVEIISVRFDIRA